MKYGVDFIKEKGVWKIWHLHLHGIFMASYYKSWVDFPIKMNPSEMIKGFPKEFQPDRPPITNWNYSPDKKTILSPVPPSPYKTFKDTVSY